MLELINGTKNRAGASKLNCAQKTRYQFRPRQNSIFVGRSWPESEVFLDSIREAIIPRLKLATSNLSQPQPTLPEQRQSGSVRVVIVKKRAFATTRACCH